MPDHRLRFILLLAVSATTASCQPAGTATPTTSSSTTMERRHVSSVVEAACGQCQFGLPGTGCDLAVRIDGNASFVDGAGIDDQGDAHAADGLCNAVRRARVTGYLIDGRFAAHSFELLPGDGQ